MDPKTKQLVEDAEARVSALEVVGTIERWEFQNGNVASVSGPSYHPNCAYRTIAIVCDDDADIGEFIARARADVPALCAALREQDKRARHAEEERDLFDKRIDELETQCESVELEHTASWFAFEKEALDAIGDEVIGMAVDAGADIPGMIKKLHRHYENKLRVMDERRAEADDRRVKAEEQRDSYKRIANIKPKKFNG